MHINLRLLYLYLFSFVGLLITVIGCTRLVTLGLKTYIFTNSDYYYFAKPLMVDGTIPPRNEDEQRKEQEASTRANREREAAEAIAMIVVGFPLFLYHWSLIQKEKK